MITILLFFIMYLPFKDLFIKSKSFFIKTVFVFMKEKGFAPTSTKYPKIILNGTERETKALV